MNEISFELPLWSATIYHSERGADNPWNRAFNVAEVADPKANKQQALRTAVELFEADGLQAIMIYTIEIAPLIMLEEGGDDGD